MAEFRWNVQPYSMMSEMIENYTQVVISATRNKAEQRAAEAREWMFNNAPWQDRSDVMRAAAVKRGVIVPARSARESLSVTPVVNGNAEKHYQGLVSKARKSDEKLLRDINRQRGVKNRVENRPPSRQLQPRTSLYKKQSQLAGIEQRIRAFRGPIVELRFSHGEDIWYAIWLEVAHGGRFSIIDRAIAHWGDILMRDIKQIANLQQFSIELGPTQTPEEMFESHVAMMRRLGDYELWSPERQARQRANRIRWRKYKQERETYLREHEAGLRRAEEREEAERQRRREREFLSQTGGILSFSKNRGR